MSRIDPSRIIDRAAWLIDNDYVQGEPEPGSGVKLCWSQRFGAERIYSVTVRHCTCWMGENKTSIICKHRWACWGEPGIVLILELREAHDLETLEAIGRAYAPKVQDLNQHFLEYARKEYIRKQEELEVTEAA